MRGKVTASEGERRLAELLDDVEAVLWEADPQTFAFTSVSKGAEALLGYPVEEWLSDPDFWRAHLHPDDRSAAVALCEAATAMGMDHEFDYRMIARDGGTRWVRDVVRVERDARGRPTRLRGILYDETRLHALRREKRLRSSAPVAAGVTHDLNNALTIVSMCVESLIVDLPRNERFEEHVPVIRHALAKASDLSRLLLSMGRPGATGTRQVDVNQAVRGLLPLLGRSLGNNIRVETSLDPAVSTIRIDPVQLDRALVNLVLNARDAMPDGGIVSLVTSGATSPGEDGALDDTVEIRIRDTGVGMNVRTRTRIFEPFFTTKSADRGTGLGLVVVDAVVREHGGTIAVESEPGQGTCFTLRFPASRRP